MRIHSLLYHDVTPPGQPLASGFQDPIAARYKLTEDAFRQHLAALDEAKAGAAMRADHLLRTHCSGFTLTFDDGGESFLSPISNLLLERNWLGNFFITTGQLGEPGFLTRDQLQDLAAQGHAIGSHSCTHPSRMSALPDQVLLSEWRDSKIHLETILDQPITLASIPGGYYSRRVAAAAALAGYEILMTSEPTSRTWSVDGCVVLGRYSIVNTTPPQAAASLARGRVVPRLKQSLLWSAKKTIKRCLGSNFRSVSESVWKSRMEKPISQR